MMNDLKEYSGHLNMSVVQYVFLACGLLIHLHRWDWDVP